MSLSCITIYYIPIPSAFLLLLTTNNYNNSVIDPTYSTDVCVRCCCLQIR